MHMHLPFDTCRGRDVCCLAVCRHVQRHGSRRSHLAHAVDPVASPDISAIEPRKILVLGGTGRVGSATAASLLQLTPGHRVTLAGREQSNYDALVAKRPELSGAAFESVQIYDFESVKAAAQGQDLVVHAAGPFQRREDITALRACAFIR